MAATEETDEPQYGELFRHRNSGQSYRVGHIIDGKVWVDLVSPNFWHGTRVEFDSQFEKCKGK
jgi:hypothetical protein